MANTCAWFINLSDDEGTAQAAARQLQPYGLPVKGQRWPQGLSWLAAAQEAAAADAAVIVLIGDAQRFADPGLRRDLALFRLMLHSRAGRPLNGFTLLSGEPPSAAGRKTELSVLDDWEPLSGNWPAKLVARAHAPIAPAWPVHLGLHAHERLGVWLETHPHAGGATDGALVGVSGHDAKIDFHAVGPKGGLPSTTDNQYEIKGLQFTAAGTAFEAWGLRNPIAPDERYYVRLEGDPDLIALGTLPDGELQDVTLIRLG
ncbi:hypothetical protein [Castellaniella denitrificans]|uniref:TIR domain-containing protein n=1 Tax=Castellaniella denitrificans TaxID=56119 RepID=A0ABT4M3B1_9BURK|nr:hypothetical protein [Castellaniella denitrificans]MCZ4329808.1 hypothetical protein [Castellaniella denitrificans]